MPKVTPMRLVNSSTGADDLRPAKFPICCFEAVVEVRPLYNVCLHEDRARLVAGFGGVFVDELLSFGAEGEVGKEDVAVAFEQHFGEGVIDT